MTDWIYRFTENATFPEPLEEISELCAMDDEGTCTYLLLNRHSYPPMSRASVGDTIYLCTSADGQLIVHATGQVVSTPFRGETPESVLALHGSLCDRFFCPIGDISTCDAHGLDHGILSAEEQRRFTSGQATAKQLGNGCNSENNVPSGNSETLDLGRVVIPLSKSPFETGVVVGLDPTAGTWESRMTRGPKGMPSVALHVSADGIINAVPNPVGIHESNADFWNCVDAYGSKTVCIDGPCATNGPGLLDDLSAWDTASEDGMRQGERELAKRGVGLFWTTKNTVLKFLGASRWIARSLVLFSEQPQITAIETHPHGAFTFLWRAFGKTGSPPKKTRAEGRAARLAILQAFVPNLQSELLPDHDAVDAACAALVGALHVMGLTNSFGTIETGGSIWMPDFVANSLMS